MRRYDFTIVLICLAAIGLVLLLLPDPMVKLEAKMASLEPENALIEFAQIKSASDRSRNLNLMHARLAMAAGDFAAARTQYLLVDDDVSQNPEILDELAALAAMSGDLADAREFKTRAHALAPDVNRRQDLGYWLRLSGDREAEADLLATVPLRSLTGFEKQRLSELLLASGNIHAYRDMLTDRAAAKGDDALEARGQLLELAIEMGDAAGALRFALDWSAADPLDRDNLELSLRTLIARGATAEALELAEFAVTRNPHIGSVPVYTFIAAGHGGIARRLQDLWLDTDPLLDSADWIALSVIAERSGDLAALRHALVRNVTDDAPPPPDAFLQFLRYQGARALMPYRAHMTEDLFAQMPLLGAAWYSLQRNAPHTFAFLVAAANSAEVPLTDWDRSIWMSITQDLRGTPYYRELLSKPSRDAKITALMHDSVLPVISSSLPDGVQVPIAD